MKIPGFSRRAPALPPRPAPVVSRTDPSIAAAGKKLRTSELRRTGRSAMTISGGAGVAGDAPLSQPAAYAAMKLGHRGVARST